MKIKHKLLSDYQYTSGDKKIFLIKSGTILEEYVYKLKNESILLDKEVVDANPQLFCLLDWKTELLTYIKSNKLPTPAVLTKKLIPFIEEMVLSSIQQNPTPVVVVDDSSSKEIERKSADLESRDKRIKEKEDEIEIRLKRLEKREGEYKEDLKSLDKKEDELRNKSKEIIEKQLDLDDKIQDLNEKERNIDRSALESSKEIDEKYVKLQKKIDSDLKILSEREKDLETKSKSLSKKESDLEKMEGEIQDKSRGYESSLEVFDEVDETIIDLNETADLLNDFNSKPFTQEYLIYIHKELKNSISKIKEIIKNAK
jgi:DNA repair exonuclease SbcCD ATPase subunit